MTLSVLIVKVHYRAMKALQKAIERDKSRIYAFHRSIFAKMSRTSPGRLSLRLGA